MFVRFVGEYLVPSAPTTSNRLLDGHLATVSTASPDARLCPSGATDAVAVRVFVPGQHVEPPGSGHNVDVVACYAGPDAAGFPQDMDVVIDSMRVA